ncbi:MAG: Hpt domain-containing protein [Candidatus Omnitrophica bacterium]|nr:Hpt domain-containing protein [Candidatus Omnitrophota bacterium]
MSQIIDLKDAMERVQDDKELLLELFDIFVEDFVGKQKGLWEAFKKGDCSAFQMLSHGLKGATGNISAHQMHLNCIELDKMGKGCDLAPAEPKLKLLDQQFEELKVEIAKVKKEFGK